MEPGSVMSDSACRTSTWGQADVARQTFPAFALNSAWPRQVHLEADFRLLKVQSAPTSKSLGEELSQVLGACQPLIDPDTRNGETRAVAASVSVDGESDVLAHFCLTAMAAISILASLTKAAA